MMCRMSPDVCTNILGVFQFTAVDELCRLCNSGEHVDGGAYDDACLGSRHDYWAHVPTGMQTAAALCGTSTTGTSCCWN